MFNYLLRAIVLVTALPVHECAHALVAGKLGDDTAAERGRLTLNPFVHLDLVGSVLMLLVGFGWAKPVPVDPRNFRHPRRDMALTALAGPLSNLCMATLLVIVYKLVLHNIWAVFAAVGQSNLVILISIFATMIMINIYLAVFNLLPIPPLDGSKILGGILPAPIYAAVVRYERYIAMVLFIMLWLGFLGGPLGRLGNYVLQGLDTVIPGPSLYPNWGVELMTRG